MNKSISHTRMLSVNMIFLLVFTMCFCMNSALVIMAVAQVDDTLRLPLYAMNLSETTSLSMEEQVGLIHRILQSQNPVGKRYFPRCNELIDEIMGSDDLLELAGYNSNQPGERVMKRKKFMELQETFKMAFNQDKEETISSSSNSM
ncbi:hypothetical protein MKX01_001603 [Papaver californicum]|nr:hypothetical protein MKX01_001603 [Papaver californicum]